MTPKIKSLFIIFFPLLFFPYFVEDFLSVSYVNYVIILFFAFLLLLFSPNKRRLFLSPSYITALYLYICFLLGDYLFRNAIYIDSRHYYYYCSWTHQRLANCYINLATYLGLLSYYLCPKKGLYSLIDGTFKIDKSAFLKLASVFLVLLIVLRRANEGVYEVAVTISCFVAVALLYSTYRYVKKPYRFLGYLLIVLLFAIVNSDDKRNSIFLFYVIALLELPELKKISLKQLIIGLSGVLLLVSLVIFMSVMRTTSEHISTKEAIELVPDYLGSDASQAIIADNFEIDFTYIDAFQPIEFIEKNPSLLTYGESYIKPLFLVVPRSIFPNKPVSAMIRYTMVYDYSEAVDGYCLPINIASEAYWNFRFFGLIIVFLIYYFLNSFYCRGYNLMQKRNDYNNIIFLYMSYMTIMLIRGSGLDLYIYQFIICIVFTMVLKKIINTKKNIRYE